MRITRTATLIILAIGPIKASMPTTLVEKDSPGPAILVILFSLLLLAAGVGESLG
jgi:hypothetical protein